MDRLQRIDRYKQIVKNDGVDACVKAIQADDSRFCPIGDILNWVRGEDRHELFRTLFLGLPQSYRVELEFSMLWRPDYFQFCFDSGLNILDLERIASDSLFALLFDSMGRHDEITKKLRSWAEFEDNFCRIVDIYLANGGDIDIDTQGRSHLECIPEGKLSDRVFHYIERHGADPARVRNARRSRRKIRPAAIGAAWAHLANAEPIKDADAKPFQVIEAMQLVVSDDWTEAIDPLMMSDADFMRLADWWRLKNRYGDFMNLMLKVRGHMIEKEFQLLWTAEHFEFCIDSGLSLAEMEEIASAPLFGLFFKRCQPIGYDYAPLSAARIDYEFCQFAKVYRENGGNLLVDSQGRDHVRSVGDPQTVGRLCRLLARVNDDPNPRSEYSQEYPLLRSVHEEWLRLHPATDPPTSNQLEFEYLEFNRYWTLGRDASLKEWIHAIGEEGISDSALIQLLDSYERRDPRFAALMKSVKGHFLEKELQMLWTPEHFKYCINDALTMEEMESIAQAPLLALFFDRVRPFDHRGPRDAAEIEKDFCRVAEMYVAYGGDVSMDTHGRDHLAALAKMPLSDGVCSHLVNLEADPARIANFPRR